MSPTAHAVARLVLLTASLMVPALAGATKQQADASPLAFSLSADLAKRLIDRSPEAADALRGMAGYTGRPTFGAVGLHKGTERLDAFPYLTRYQHDTYPGLHDRLHRTWARMVFEGASGMLVNTGGFVEPLAGHVEWISIHLLMRGFTQGFPRYPQALDHLDFAAVAWNNMKLALPAEARHDAASPDVVALHRGDFGEGSWDSLRTKCTIWDGKQTVITRDHGTPLEDAQIFDLLKPHINGSRVPKIRVYRIDRVEIESLARLGRTRGAQQPITRLDSPAAKASSTKRPSSRGGGATVIPHDRLIMARMRRHSD